jgi:uncharacterized RDD family membrane protein YckC
LLGPLMFLLVVSIAGILVVPFLLCGFLILGLFGKVAMLQYTGRQLGRQTRLNWAQVPMMALVVGMVLFSLIYMVPVLGFLVWGLVVPFCLGAGVVAITKSFKRQIPNAQAQTGAATGPSWSGIASADMGAAGTRMNVLFWPRAGFWIRIWANILDAIVLLVVMNLLHTSRYILVAWLAYHVVMWTWRGTTIGGAICHLKMVRYDGQPVGFPVALIRCLAAFISAFALGLGFFWSAWDKERQAWHDKIAGTVIVKSPSGLPLI